VKIACIVGVGLMGGSLGLALRRTKKWRVVGVDQRAKAFHRAIDLGAVDVGTTDLSRAVQKADVVVLAVPVDKIVTLAKEARRHMLKTSLLMDVGSVKGPLVETLDKIGFVGAHPLTGSEKTGVENARPDLFKGATCIITPGPRTPVSTLRRANALWRALGSRVIRMSPQDHDRWMAMMSHLPHLMASALVLSASRWGDPRMARMLAAGSFRDATRVGAANAALWAPIFKMNRPALRRAVALFQNNLASLVP
jgi:prephenate dehydrogenase